MNTRSAAAFAVLFALAAVPVAPAADTPGKDEPKSVLADLIRKQQQKQADEKDPAPARLKERKTAERREDTRPLSPEPDAELDAVLDRMENTRKSIKTLECRLTKRKEMPLFEIDDEFRGTFKFRTPRFLRMELTGPVPEGDKKSDQSRTITIVNEEYAYIWRVADREAERYRLPSIKDKKFSERNPLEYGLAADIRNLKRDYYVNLRGKEEVDGRPTWKVVAGPKPGTKDAPYKRLYFWIDEKEYLPVRFRQVKSDGEIIETYTLSEIEKNPSWRGDPFGRPPKDVYVIATDLARPNP